MAGGAALLVLSECTSALADGREVGRTAPPSGGEDSTDSRRGELVFLEAELGPTYVDMLALKDADLLDSARVKSSGFAFAYAASLGVRLHDLTLAARYRRGDFSDWQLSTLGGDVGMRLTLGRIAPHFALGAGYASLGGIRADISRAAAPNPDPVVHISGLNLRVQVGVDYYVRRWFSVGANLSGDAFFLRRRGDRLPRTSSTDPNSPVPFAYAMDGSGNGLGATLGLVLGLHY
jgi:hypothetical protein